MLEIENIGKNRWDVRKCELNYAMFRIWFFDVQTFLTIMQMKHIYGAYFVYGPNESVGIGFPDCIYIHKMK